MKTPNEIKKGLECCKKGNACRTHCPYDGWRSGMEECTSELADDALALIQQLEDHLREATKKIEQLEAEREDMTARYKIADDCAKKKGEMNEKLYAELSAVKAERDAAVRDLTEMAQDTDESCEYCEMFKTPHCSLECRMKNKGFKWRGVQKEE